MSERVLEVKDLHKTFRIGFRRKRVEALRGVSFHVSPNEIVGLVGPNGAGKTTALKILTGLISPDQGSAKMFGRDVGEVGVRARIGYLPEGPYFYEHLRAPELLRFYGQLLGVKAGVLAKRIPELIDVVGLSDATDRPIRKFSKGMRQRIGIAQALINDPEFVILDEPQSGLDPTGRREVRDLIAGLRRDGKTVMFSSHILPDVEAVCDRVIVMHEGLIREQGALSGLTGDEISTWEIIARDVEPTSLRSPALLRHEKRGEAYVMWFEGDAVVEDVVRELLELNAKLVNVAPQRVDLEEIFIRDTVSSDAKSHSTDDVDRDEHVPRGDA